LSLQDKKVVVIGGTSGIGLAVARMAAEERAQVIVASSSADKVEGAQAALPTGTQALRLDVRDESAIEAFFNSIGKFDHLVYTAGDWPLPLGIEVAEMDIPKAADIFSIRFWCALASIKHAVKHIHPDGSITLTDGSLGGRARKGAPVLAAMAAAVEHLVRALALDLAPVRVNGVAPGGVETPTDDPSKLQAREAVKDRLKKTLPLGRLGQPEEIAQAYLYLMKGGYTTGQIMFVDGGGVL